MTFDYVLNMSYANMILYGAVLPSYDKKDGSSGGKGPKKKTEERVIKADDPANKEDLHRFLEECD